MEVIKRTKNRTGRRKMMKCRKMYMNKRIFGNQPQRRGCWQKMKGGDKK